VAVLFVALAAAAVLCRAPPGELTVFLDVKRGGNATVTMVLRDSSSGSVSLFLPRFESWSYTVLNGDVVGVERRNTSAFFYSNVTFTYSTSGSAPLTLNISFRFPFAALYSGDRGWFMSPLIGGSPLARLEVVISIEDLGELSAVTVNNVAAPYTLTERTVRIAVPSYLIRDGVRVTLDFRPSEAVGEVQMLEVLGGTVVEVRAAPFYRGLARKVALVVNSSLPALREIFGYGPERVEFRFFLPSRMDLSALGYVMGEDINAEGRGPVYLNLALIRFKEGYLETTVVHELVHKALGALGVPASSQLRWFHEGVAQYVSLKVCERLGVDVGDVRGSLDQATELFRRGALKPGFVSTWGSAYPESSYYAASYYIVSTLAEERGGLDYLRRVMEEIRRRGGVKSNAELIDALSAAAGEDLAPVFKAWGFPLERGEVAAILTKLGGWLTAVVALALLAAVALSLLVVVRRRYTRCPYCYAHVPLYAAYCPYCSYPLREAGEPPSAPLD